MEATFEGKQLRLVIAMAILRPLARKFDGRFVRLGTGIGKENPVSERVLNKKPRQLNVRDGMEQVADMG